MRPAVCPAQATKEVDVPIDREYRNARRAGAAPRQPADLRVGVWQRPTADAGRARNAPLPVAGRRIA
jgi:hypothetical protein